MPHLCWLYWQANVDCSLRPIHMRAWCISCHQLQAWAGAYCGGLPPTACSSKRSNSDIISTVPQQCRDEVRRIYFSKQHQHSSARVQYQNFQFRGRKGSIRKCADVEMGSGTTTTTTVGVGASTACGATAKYWRRFDRVDVGKNCVVTTVGADTRKITSSPLLGCGSCVLNADCCRCRERERERERNIQSTSSRLSSFFERYRDERRRGARTARTALVQGRTDQIIPSAAPLCLSQWLSRN